MEYISTIAFAIIVLFFVSRGYQKGLGSSMIRIASCLLGYILAIFFTNPISKLIAAIPYVDGLIVYFIAGSFILITVITISDKMGNRLFDKFLYKKPIHESTYTLLKLGGGLVGIIVGCFLGFIAAYLINFHLSQLSYKSVTTEISNIAQPFQKRTDLITRDDAHSYVRTAKKETKKIQEKPTYRPIQTKRLQEKPDSFIDGIAKKVVSSALTVAVKVTTKDEAAAGLTQVVASNPQKSINYIRRISNDPQIINILSNTRIQKKLRNGNIPTLMSDRQFKKLLANKNIQSLVNQSRKGSSDISNNSYTSDRKTTRMLILAWRRLEKIKNDKRVLKIIHDPEFQETLQTASMANLLLNKELKTLSDIILGK